MRIYLLSKGRRCGPRDGVEEEWPDVAQPTSVPGEDGGRASARRRTSVTGTPNREYDSLGWDGID